MDCPRAVIKVNLVHISAICMSVSWLVYDDVTEKIIHKRLYNCLPEGVTIPKVCSDIHELLMNGCNEGVDISGVLQEFTSD